MSIETATYVDSLNTANPADTDSRSSADDHARLIKASLRRTFPAIAGQVSASHGEVNFLRSASVAIQAQIDVIKSGSYSVTYAKSAGYALSAKYAASTSIVLYANTAGYAADVIQATSVGEQIVAGQRFQGTSAAASVTYTVVASLSARLAASSIYRIEFGGFSALESGSTATAHFKLYGIDGEPVPGAVLYQLPQYPLDYGYWQTFGNSAPAFTRTYDTAMALLSQNAGLMKVGLAHCVLETSASFRIGIKVKGANNLTHTITNGMLSAIRLGARP